MCCGKERAHNIIADAIGKSENGIVVLTRFAPWQDQVCETDAKFTVFPSPRGGYNLQCVPPTPDSKDKRIPLPEKWLSERPEHCGFVHTGLHLAQFDTKEHAVEAAHKLVEHNIEKKMDFSPRFDKIAPATVPEGAKKLTDMVSQAKENSRNNSDHKARSSHKEKTHGKSENGPGE